MKLDNGGHVKLRAPEGDQQYADLSIIAPQGPSAAVYLTGGECHRLAHILGEMGDGLLAGEEERAVFAVIARVRDKSNDAQFCILCHADPLANGTGFDHLSGCPIAKLDPRILA